MWTETLRQRKRLESLAIIGTTTKVKKDIPVNIRINPETNIILIGMPWSGKSSMGVVLAKFLARPFLDTDIVIQTGERRALQDIIEQEGVDALRTIEERYILNLVCQRHVIATGGSVVYSNAAMNHLKQIGCCVYLQVPLPELELRATGIEQRGLIRAPGQGLAELYAERTPLYEHYADIAVHCGNMSQSQVLEKLLKQLQMTGQD